MLQEQSNKFCSTYCFDLGSVVVSIVFIPERYGFISNGTDPAVADRRPVSITGEVSDGISIAVKCLFDKRKPVSGIKGIYEFLPVVSVTESRTFTSEVQEFFIVIKFQFLHKFTTKHRSNHFHRKQKPLVACFSELAGSSKPATGKTAMKVGMEIQLLSP